MWPQSSNLTSAVHSDQITSTFLDEALHMFFIKFGPTFPVLHRPTFVFRDCLQVLILNCIAIGSLYLGPKESRQKGETLWHLAHTQISTSWQTLLMHRTQFDTCSGVQLLVATSLGKLYGILSQNRSIRTISQAFHALGFFCANKSGMFNSEPYDSSDLLLPIATEAEKKHQWHLWAAREIQHRSVLAHYLVDGLKSHMSGDATAVRHTLNTLSVSCDEDLFNASTADEWVALMHEKHVSSAPQREFKEIYHLIFTPAEAPNLHALSACFSSFTYRVLLEGLQSLAADSTDDLFSAIGVPSRQSIRSALATFHSIISAPTSIHVSVEERNELLLRWHAICLETLIPSTTLCRHICSRFSIRQHIWAHPMKTPSTMNLDEWVHTADARRSLLHAIAIQDAIEQLPRGRAHAPHMPSSLLAAASVYYAFAVSGLVSIKLPADISWEDVLSPVDEAAVQLAELSGTAVINDTTRFVLGHELGNSIMGAGRGTRNVRYELNSIQKLFGCLATQWGIAKDMEEVISQWNAMCH